MINSEIKFSGNRRYRNEAYSVDMVLTFTKRTLIWTAKFSTLYNTAFEQCAIIILGYIKTCLPQITMQQIAVTSEVSKWNRQTTNYTVWTHLVALCKQVMLNGASLTLRDSANDTNRSGLLTQNAQIRTHTYRKKTKGNPADAESSGKW